MIKRKLLKELNNHLSHKEISLIIGPRQAGKTTLMRVLEEYLKGKGETTLFLNLDREKDRRYFSSQEDLIGKIRLEMGEEKGFVFIDEIQRKENAGLFLKGIYDSDLPYKFIVSGSGSVELKEKIHESLAGRKRVFKLGTISFEEFVQYKTDYKYESKLDAFFKIEDLQSYRLLEEYLSYGGYPRVVLAETLKEKSRIIDEIYQSYLEKDVKFLLNVKKTEAFTNLVRIIAAQAGKLVNYAEFSSTLGISFKTVKKYLWYLQKTFILHKTAPYFTNMRKEITKAPIYYFYDLGFRNYAAGIFGRPPLTADLGFLFQNLVYLELFEKTLYSPTKVNFWRTKDRAKVDFIISSAKKALPIEVKYKKLEKFLIPRSLKSFTIKYNPNKAYIINLSLSKTVRINNTHINIIPFFELVHLNLSDLSLPI